MDVDTSSSSLSSRPDGRSATEQRAFDVRFGTLSRADGSARVSMGPTAILASFSGPIEVRIRDERLDRATLEVSHRPLDGTAGIPSKTLASTLTTSLSPLLNLTAHPRSLILLTLQSLTAPPLPVLPAPRRSLDDEPSTSQPTSPHAPLPAIPLSTKSLALTASSLAAMDAASVGLSGLAVGACVVRSSPSSTGSAWVTDPSWTEERTAGARFGVGWAFGAGLGEASPSGKKPAGEEVVWFEADGAFDEKDIEIALDLSLQAARETHALIRAAVEREFEDVVRDVAAPQKTKKDEDEDEDEDVDEAMNV